MICANEYNFHNQFEQVIIYMFYEAQKLLSIDIIKKERKKKVATARHLIDRLSLLSFEYCRLSIYRT